MLIALLLTCAVEIKDAKCELACKNQGYETGQSIDNKCACVDRFDFELITQSRNENVKIKLRPF